MAHVDPSTATPVATRCARCQAALSESDRVTAGDRVFCSTCYEILKLQLRSGVASMSQDINYPMAVAGAALGGAVGVLAWWGFTVLTKIGFGLVAVVIGVAVGKGIVSFTGGKRAESLQVMAVVVAVAAYAAGTYLTKRTFILESLHRQGRLIDLPLVPTSPAYFFRIASAGFQLFDLVFLAIVMYQAWRIPAPVRLPG